MHALAFSPNARSLAVGVVPGVSLFDVATGRETRFLRQPGPIARIEFSPDGRFLAAGSRSGWGGTAAGSPDLGCRTGSPVGPLFPCQQLPFFRFSPDGRPLLVLDVADRRVVRLDAATGRPMAAVRRLDDGRSDAADAIFEW